MKRPYRLSAAFVRSVRRPGVYGDGRGGSGLALRVHRTAGGDVSKSWRQKLNVAGRQTSIGLGSWPFVTLDDARKAAIINKGKALSGIDPRIVAASPAPVQVAPVASAPAFEAAAESAIRLRRSGWKGDATENRWRRSLRGLPFLAKPVSEVTSADVLAVVEPDWMERPYAAKARLQSVRAAMKWAIGAGHRTDDPTDTVKAALPRQVNRTKHFRAVAVADAPEALRALRTCGKSRKLTRLAIEFAVLTASRPGEAAGADWSEIDGDTWTIPPERMKAGQEHRVPLSGAALDVLKAAARETGKRTGLVFPSTTGKPVGSSAIRKCLQVCGIEATAHGWRSTFRDFCGEQGIDRTLAELSLAHRIGDSTELAYARSDLLERRLREALEPWAAHLA